MSGLLPPDDPEPVPAASDAGERVLVPLAATLGEMLEAHHSRFVERIRERERKERGE